MTAHPPDSQTAETASPPRRKPTRAQRAVAFTFLGAFAATMATVVLTGLHVRSPSARRELDTPTVTLAVGVPRTIDLAITPRPVTVDVEVTVDLPPGVELAMRDGGSRAVWQTRLAAGERAVPVMLVARSGRGGQLAAQLRQGEERRTFVFDLVVEQ